MNIIFRLGDKWPTRLRPSIISRSHPLALCIWPIFLCLICAATSAAMPLSEYQQRVRQGITALDTLATIDEGESPEEYKTRLRETASGLRTTLPKEASVEWQGTIVKVDNSWLHTELEKVEKVSSAEQAYLLSRLADRLQAIEERLSEIDKGSALAGASKAESSRRLAEILRRPEYAKNANQGSSALSRILRRFLKWLMEWVPRPQPLAPGGASLLSEFAQLFVIALAIAVVAYVIKIFAPHVLRRGRSMRKVKKEPRIVLGEKLEADQSAADLLSEAEALARRGELRMAIRKAYIAFLVELGDRKVISLAQYKTNRDYVTAVRQLEPLYGNVKQLTDSFERHWYGFVNASENDWLAFRARCREALGS